MIKPVQINERVHNIIFKSFENDKKSDLNNREIISPELMAARYKYGLACLYAASVMLENEKLRQELANATTQYNYERGC